MQEGVLCEADVCCGIASQSILDAIESNRIDLAIVGTKARHGVTRFWFGSTAEDVLRNAICPVMTIGPHAAATMEQEKKQGPVVFATDFSTATLPAIRYACRFRETTQLPLYCLNVLPRSLESVPTGGSLQHVLNDGLSHLAKESGAVEPMPICATSYGSDISYAIVEYAREQHAKMIVLGVRQASMLKSHLPVHVTFRVITEAPCPVVTMAYSSTSAETAMLTAISVQ